MLAAIYCRLSKEDEDRQLESESIQNQRSLLVKYAVEQGWDIYNIFCDEDYSGVDRERPAFAQLISDAQQGKFNLLLVKTQSRFTRDMELVEKYIHGLFPIWGIRFVAVVDNVDTDMKGNKKARQINGLMNEWYLEDLSENIRAVFDYKRRAGQYIGGFPIYGYQKDPRDKHKLVIDPEAAEVVRRIYTLFLCGHGKQHIALLLNQESVPNPTRHKQLKGCGYVNGAQTNELGLWSRTSVGRILREQMYAGDMVQGRRKKVSYKSKYIACVPQEDWMIVPGTHEPIVDRETFATVQRLLGERTRSSGTGEVHLLAGKVKCKDCGSTMVKVSTTYQGVRRSYLRCKRYATDPRLCSNHSIRLDALEEQVLVLLQQYIKQYYDCSTPETLIAGDRASQKKTALEREVKHLALEVARRDKAMRDLYLDKSRGLVDEGQFREWNRAYLGEKAAFQARLTALSSELTQLEDQGGHLQKLRETLAHCLDFDRLTRELVSDFIDWVEVGQRAVETGVQSIHIHWLF